MNEFQRRPLISFITVNFNGLDFLKNLYDSLRNISYKPIELILVDNASTDDSVTFVHQNYPEVKIIQNPDNYMYARGNNEGIKVAKGEIICIINNDIKVEPSFLEPIVDQFISNPEMAACQPKVLDLNRPDYFEYAGAAGGFIDKYGFPFMRGRLFFTVEQDKQQYDSILEIFWSTGACFFIRKFVIAELGSLDEDFVMHMEEIDLCWRMHLTNHKIYCIPQSRVWHKGGGTLSSDNPRKSYWNYRNNFFLLVKNLGMINLIRIIPIRLLFDLIAVCREIIIGKIGNALAIIKAYFWIIFHLRLLKNRRRENQKIRINSDKEIFKLVYHGSIVWEYFICRRKKISELENIDHIINS